MKKGDKKDLLTILDKWFIEENGKKKYFYKIFCECGTIKIVTNIHQIKSCGCIRRKENASRCKAQTIHGLSNYRGYKTWKNMKYFCKKFSLELEKEWNRFHPFSLWLRRNKHKSDCFIKRLDTTKGFTKENLVVVRRK